MPAWQRGRAAKRAPPPQGGQLLSTTLASLAMDDETSDKVLFASVTDPEGNAITLVEWR